MTSLAHDNSLSAGTNLDQRVDPLAMANLAVAPSLGEATADNRIPPRMCVRVGELGLLIPADGGHEVMPPPPIGRIPNTVSWLCGLANVRGRLVPVVDLVLALGVARATTAASRYLLICGQGDSAMGLLIDGLPHVVAINDAERLTAPPAVPTLLVEAVAAAYDHDHQVWIDVDLRTLFDTLARHIAL